MLLQKKKIKISQTWLSWVRITRSQGILVLATFSTHQLWERLIGLVGALPSSSARNESTSLSISAMMFDPLTYRKRFYFILDTMKCQKNCSFLCLINPMNNLKYFLCLNFEESENFSFFISPLWESSVCGENYLYFNTQCFIQWKVVFRSLQQFILTSIEIFLWF